MKHASKRILAWLLCAVMLLALLPSFAAAEEDASPLDPPALADGEPTEELPDDGDPAIDEPTEELPETDEPALDEPSEELPVTEPAAVEPEGNDVEVTDEFVNNEYPIVVLDEEIEIGLNYFEVEEINTIYYRPFHPTKDGFYRFNSYNAGTHYVYLADSELNCQKEGDSIFAPLHAGETYYYGILNPRTSNTITKTTNLVWYPMNSCGDSMTWTFDEDTGTLAFSGSGEMWSYGRDEMPWAIYKDQIKTVDFTAINLFRLIDYAFYDYENLTSALFQNGLFPKAVGKYTFYGTGLTEVNLASGPDMFTFANCKNLKTVTISATGGFQIMRGAFKDSGVQTVRVSEDFCNILYHGTSIQPYAFAGCTDLETVDLGDQLYQIYDHAFENSGVKTIRTTNELSSIWEYAFAGCANLESITTTGLRNQIPKGAFQNSGIRSMFIPKTVTKVAVDAFSGCTKLDPAAFQVSDYSTTYQAKDGMLLTKDGETLVLAIPSLTSCTVPDGVHTIGTNAFCELPLLTSVTLVPGVFTVEDSAFKGCSALQTVTMHPSVSEIRRNAFSDCPALTDVQYQGYEEDRVRLTIDETGNDALLNATWHYLEKSSFDGAVVWNDEDVQFKGTTPYMTWTGSALEPRFALNDAEGNPVDPQTYTYEYRENVDAGTGYVFVTFTEGYTGVLRQFFKIYLPATTQTSVENVADGIRISWAPVEGATGYVIYRRAWNLQSAGWTTFERWNNTTGTSWTDKTVYAGTRYQYGVKAYFAQRMDAVTGAMIGGNVGDNFNLGHVGPLKTTVRITTRHLVSLKPASGKITATWEASKVFTGYQLKYATNEAFTKDVKTVKIADPSTVSMVLKSLKNGTTYYVAVRSYHEFAGMTYFGQWSNVIRVKAGAVYTVYDVMYRALTIGENNYKTSPLKGCVNDATAMTGMLQGLNRPFTVNKLRNEKKASIIKAIRTTFADAWDNDISVFTYSGHGVQASDSSNPYHGALVPIDEDYITLKELAQELSKVRGRIVVILDSCHSGAAIALDGGASETDAFNQAVIEAFSGYYLEDDAQEGEPGTRMGEMRTSKFIVITAAGYWQSSYDGKFDGSGYDQGAFTAALIKGMGCRYTSGKYLGSMPADQNNDK